MIAGAEQRARELIVFADGLEEGGLVDYARRARMVARDALDAIAELDAERSARRALQAERDRLRAMLWPGAYDAPETAGA